MGSWDFWRRGDSGSMQVAGEENEHEKEGGVGLPPGPSAVGAPGLEGPRLTTEETAQKMMRVIATDEVDMETSELLDKVRESITEVSANK